MTYVKLRHKTKMAAMVGWLGDREPMERLGFHYIGKGMCFKCI